MLDIIALETVEVRIIKKQGEFHSPHFKCEKSIEEIPRWS
jgi:hypothetical protein